MSPLNLESKGFFVKMAFGISSGGNISDSWNLNPGLYDYTQSQGEKPGREMDLALELIFQIHPNIGLSLGTGTFSKRIHGSTRLFTPFGPGEPVADFSLTPELISDITPIYLTAILTFPIMPSFQVNFQGGIGYYWGSIRGGKLDENWDADINPAMIANRLLWKFESSANAIGFHSGAEIDIAVHGNVFFFMEALYREGSFKKFNASLRTNTNLGLSNGLGQTGENLGEDSTFFYAQKVRSVEQQKDIDYRISNLKFSGYSFRVGIKVGFNTGS
jgi:hypothetical protein